MRRGASTTTAAAARISPLIASICAEKLLRSVAGPSSACFCSTPRWAAMRPRSCSTSLPRAASSCSVPMSRSSSSAETGAGTGEAAAEGGDCASTGPASAKSSHAMHAPTPKMRDRIMAPEISRAPGQGQAPRHTIAKLPFCGDIVAARRSLAQQCTRGARETRTCRRSDRHAGEGKERGADQAEARQGQDGAGDAVEPDQPHRADAAPQRGDAEAEAEPPQQRPQEDAADQHGHVREPGIPADAHLGEDAGKGEPILLAQHEVRNDGDAEAGDVAEVGVGGGAAETETKPYVGPSKRVR